MEFKDLLDVHNKETEAKNKKLAKELEEAKQKRTQLLAKLRNKRK